jgi:hypothetical protein
MFAIQRRRHSTPPPLPRARFAWLAAAALLLLAAGPAREARAGNLPPAVGCGCCACDFGDGDVECGPADANCAECELLGGVPAADCSVCAQEDGCPGNTLCDGDPDECAAPPPPETGCGCCACDFGDGDVLCGFQDADCEECFALGGQPAADCSSCGNTVECEANTLCGANPQCGGSAQTPTETPTATGTATVTATPVPGGGACMQTSDCGAGLECVGNVCTAIPAGAPPTSTAGLLAAVAAMTAAAALTLRRRAR